MGFWRKTTNPPQRDAGTDEQIWRLAERSERAQGGFDGLKIGQILWVFLDFGVLNDAGFIDDEGRAFGDATHDQIGGR